MPKEKISDLDGLHKALVPVARDSAAVDSLLLTHRKMLEGAIKTIPKDNPGPMLPILKLLHGLPSVASVNAMIHCAKLKWPNLNFQNHFVLMAGRY